MYNDNVILDVDNLCFEQLSVRFAKEYGVLSILASPKPRPCATTIFLTSLLSVLKLINTNGHVVVKGEMFKVNYLILASDCNGIFNLGGDLDTFNAAIQTQARDELLEYGRLCVDNVWHVYAIRPDITTISLVQGQAMGGGFEVALASDFIIAEQGSMMGFPEAMFDLFPGMGALSLLSRKVGMVMAESMIRSGKIYSTMELSQAGLIEVVTGEGEGEQAVSVWIEKNHRMLHTVQAVNKSKRVINRLTLDELYEIVEIWVDTALQLGSRSRRIMERLVRAQNARILVHDSAAVDRTAMVE